jgi:hypothetical protein
MGKLCRLGVMGVITGLLSFRPERSRLPPDVVTQKTDRTSVFRKCRIGAIDPGGELVFLIVGNFIEDFPDAVWPVSHFLFSGGSAC